MTSWLSEYKATRQSPRLWVEDVWLLDSVEPLSITRNLKLRQGLNVVWAREPETDLASGLASAGHGVGKTSLCYLLRHCLGDEASSITVLCDKASGAFPKGGVAAKVHLDDTTWVVFRPYARFGRSLAGIGESLSELLAGQLAGSFAEYQDELQAAFIGKLPNSTLPGSAQVLEWRHLLAWCIRDQKTRFDAFFHWRDGDGLGFRRSRQDPPLFVRSVLGLHDANVDRLMREVDMRQSSLSKLEAEIPELERLPALEVTLAERRLRARLGASDDEPAFKDLVSTSLEQLLERRIEHLEMQCRKAEPAAERAELALGRALATHSDLDQKARVLELEAEIAQSVLENNEIAFNRLSEEVRELELLAGQCRHGDIDFSHCSHVIQRRSTQSLSWHFRKQAAAANLANQSKALREAKLKADAARSDVVAQDAVVDQFRQAARKIQLQLASNLNDAESLRNQWDEFVRIWKRLQNGVSSTELETARNRKDWLEEDLQKKQTELFVIRQQSSARSNFLKALTKTVAYRMLGEDGFGIFKPESDTQPFELSVGGEAYQVLEVLLGDITTLLDSALSDATLHPGLIVHDCPREADMSERLYREFLLLVSEAEAQLSIGSIVPFQYIVTTTSPPPETLGKEPYLVLELRPGDENYSLFKKQLEPRLPSIA
ncbi:hypothetical protein GCM10011419_01790 [Vogesella fluminis]|uniref:ATP-binding protein n=1 Tax=Vogesella fluminis TaxID=1069161 RepID=A0ABQ3H710_9NEIS|nr:hypothetical protein GCM10011419_01790 [Vogesella fluminis]